LVAALIAMEGGKAAKRELAKKETKGADSAAASEGAPQQGDASSDAGTEVTESTARPRRSWRPSSLNAAAKNPIAIGIAASLVLVAVLGVAWHAKRGSSVHSNRLSTAASAATLPITAQAAAPSSPPAPPAPGQPAPSTDSTSASVAGTSPKVEAVDSRGTKTDQNSSASVTSSEKTTEAPLTSDQGAPSPAKPRKSNTPKTAEIIPAKVIAQPAPSMPDWAKGLDTDRTVQLDALIDEKGNLAETRPISGPRMLQGAAQRAVALWIFEPAMADGKPIATHMTLTVEFQK
jgi:hypothetical protein